MHKNWWSQQFHLVYTSYSRGISLLTHKNLKYKVFNKEIDPQVRFIFVHVRFENDICILTFIYVPPP